MKNMCKRLASLILAAAVSLNMVSMTAWATTRAGTAEANAADSSETTTEIELTIAYGQTAARSMLEMINDFRTGSDAWYWNSDDETKTTCTGLSKLTYDYTLEAIAMQRAAEIVLSFAHTRPDGTSYSSAYEESYSWGVNLFARGENIAVGYTSAAAVFEAWQEADEDYSGQGHRRNMLSGNFTAVGIAHVVYNGVDYWVQEFGYPVELNTTKTAVDETETVVSVDVLNSAVTSVNLSVSTASCSLTCGASSPLPTVSATLLLTSTAVSTPITTTVPTNWSVADASIVTVSGGSLVAGSNGTIGKTTIAASAFGETVSVPVTVEHGATVTKNAKEATCTEEGYTGDEICTGCGSVVTAGETIPATGHPFVDVSSNAYYRDAVVWAYENGIASGVDDTHFSPKTTCTRAQVVTFLWRAAGCPEPTISSVPFSDVKNPNAYYYKAVLWAYENEIAAGVDSTHFDPSGTVTRAQFLCFLWRAQGCPKATISSVPFTDAQNPCAYYYQAILWAYENEITSGVDSTHFSPKTTCTRAQVVSFLYRALA